MIVCKPWHTNFRPRQRFQSIPTGLVNKKLATLTSARHSDHIQGTINCMYGTIGERAHFGAVRESQYIPQATASKIHCTHVYGRAPSRSGLWDILIFPHSSNRSRLASIEIHGIPSRVGHPVKKIAQRQFDHAYRARVLKRWTRPSRIAAS